MVLLKNDMIEDFERENKHALPLDERQIRNIHIVGDQLAYPVYAGGGSGEVHENSVKSPLDALCEMFHVPKFDNATKCASVKQCAEDMSRCITFTPFRDNAGGNPYRGLGEKCQDIRGERYDATLFGAGIQSSEGADRKDLEWDIATYKAVSYIASREGNGAKIAHLVAPGASVIGFDQIFDAVLYSVMPGQEFADAFVNITFGKVNPSGKLTFTLPNR